MSRNPFLIKANAYEKAKHFPNQERSQSFFNQGERPVTGCHTPSRFSRNPFLIKANGKSKENGAKRTE